MQTLNLTGLLGLLQEAIQMSQALEESMRMYEEENRRAPPDESLAVSSSCLSCALYACLVRPCVCVCVVYVCVCVMCVCVCGKGGVCCRGV